MSETGGEVDLYQPNLPAEGAVDGELIDEEFESDEDVIDAEVDEDEELPDLPDSCDEWYPNDWGSRESGGGGGGGGGGSKGGGGKRPPRRKSAGRRLGGGGRGGFSLINLSLNFMNNNSLVKANAPRPPKKGWKLP